MENKLIEWRRHTHKYPELSFEEYNTASYVAEILKGIDGVSVQTNIGKTGVVATIKKGIGRTIAIRADMDALPIEELVSNRNINASCMRADKTLIRQCFSVLQKY